jgi:hypothetical protein
LSSDPKNNLLDLLESRPHFSSVREDFQSGLTTENIETLALRIIAADGYALLVSFTFGVYDVGTQEEDLYETICGVVSSLDGRSRLDDRGASTTAATETVGDSRNAKIEG